MMCLSYRNAAELATTICMQTDVQSLADGDATRGRADAALRAALEDEQERLVREALASFGHAKHRTSLPLGTLEEVLR